MARVRKDTLGELSGKLGDIVYHSRYGKRFVRVRPRSFVPGEDAASVDRRSRFALSVKIARAIYGVPELKVIWEKTATKKPVFNFVVGVNVNSVTADWPTDLVTITPPRKESGRNLGLVEAPAKVALSSGVITAEFAAPKKQPRKSAARESRAGLAYVLCARNQKKSRRVSRSKMNEGTEFISGCSELQPVLADSAMTFRVSLSRKDEEKVRRCDEKKLFCAMLLFDVKGNPAGYSKTSAF